MTDSTQGPLDRALSRWDSEGRAAAAGPRATQQDEDRREYPPLTNAELVHLRIRVIALENLVIAMLNQASSDQLDIAREMAAYISPRPGANQHPLTMKAAEHMTDILDRADRFQSALSVTPYKTTPVFDEQSLPAGLQKEHRTKVGAWGVIRVLEGSLRYVVLDPPVEHVLDPGTPGLILPDQAHRVELIGPMRMQVEFYDQLPF